MDPKNKTKEKKTKQNKNKTKQKNPKKTQQQQQQKTKQKRGTDRTFYNDSDSDYEIRTKTMNWPRFLLVESGDESLPVTKLSPFAIDKGFQALISGRLRSIKRLRNGTFLVECDTKKQSDLLLKSHKLVDRPMKVSIHPTLNSSRGVIRCRELAGMSETDIRDELSEQGVTLVKRIRRKEENQEKDTNTLFLTFCSANLPKDIRIGYLRVKVDPFIPNPLRALNVRSTDMEPRDAVPQQCALNVPWSTRAPAPTPQVREL